MLRRFQKYWACRYHQRLPTASSSLTVLSTVAASRAFGSTATRAATLFSSGLSGEGGVSVRATDVNLELLARWPVKEWLSGVTVSGLSGVCGDVSV